MRSYEDVEPVVIALPPDWIVQRHHLMNIHPHEAGEIEHPIESGWHLYFIEDLFAAINHKAGLVIDVGWYPDSDPSGEYAVLLCKLRKVEPRPGQINFTRGDTIAEMRTRELDETIRAIESFANRVI